MKTYSEIYDIIMKDDSLTTALIMLKYRWVDERKFEDFADYKVVAKNLLVTAGLTPITSLTKGFKIILEGSNRDFVLTVLKSGIKFKSKIK